MSFLSAKISKVEDVSGKAVVYHPDWFRQPKDEIHNSVFGVCAGLNIQSQTMKHQFRMYRHLYGNSEAFFIPTTINNNDQSTYVPNNRLVANVSQAIVDTAGSLIDKSMPNPRFFTLGEDSYRKRQQASILNSFYDGVADTCTDDGANLDDEMRKVCLDARVIGTGAILAYDCDGEIKVERVLPDELLVDEVDGMFMKPRSIHRVKWIARDQLQYMFPDKAKFLEGASVNNTSSGVSIETNTDMVEVIESWHLKSGSKAKDGLHTICIATTALLYEEYKKPFFPITFYRWKDRSIGFWGVGLIEELKSLQTRLNEVLHVIQLSQELVSCPIVFCETGSNITADHLLANDIFRKVDYQSGCQPPQIVTPTAVNAELYNERDWIINQMYQISGCSQATASGTKPPEVKSGTAIEMVADIQSGRFQLQSMRLERTIIQIAKLFISIGKDIYDYNKKLAVKVLLKGNKYLTEIPFSEVADLKENEFSIKCFPISQLSSKPEGKMDQLMQMVQAGWIQKEDAMNEMQLIDLDDYTNRVTAPLNLIRKMLSKMVNDGTYTSPDPTMNLQLALSEASLELQRARLDMVDEENIQLVRDFINDINDLLNAANPPTPPMQQSAPPPTGTTPTAQPPQSVSPPGSQGQNVVGPQ